MTDKLIVGITGKKRHGKDTIAHILSHHYGYDLLRFSYTLKEMFRTYLRTVGVPESLIEMYVTGDWRDKPCDTFLMGESARYFEQTLGTEWGRMLISDDIWVNALERRVGLSASSFIVIPDVRFANEAEKIVELGGVVIKVDRPGYGTEDTHCSEKAEGFVPDHVIMNTGTVQDLENEAHKLQKMIASVFLKAGE